MCIRDRYWIVRRMTRWRSSTWLTATAYAVVGTIEASAMYRTAPTRARHQGVPSAGTKGASSTARSIGDRAMPIDATNQVTFRRLAAVSTRDFQIKYGMAGAATAKSRGQYR